MPEKLGASSYRFLLFYFLFAALVHFVQLFNPELLPAWFQLFGFQAFILLALLLLYRKGWRPRFELSLRPAAFSILALLAYFGLLALLNLLASNFVELGDEDIFHGATSSIFVLQILVAPFLEELFFRDYLQRAFFVQMRRWSHAILFSSAFFMLAHFSLYPGAFILGLINACLFLWTRSVLPCIGFHVISNLSWYFLPSLFPALFRFLAERDWMFIFYR